MMFKHNRLSGIVMVLALLLMIAPGLSACGHAPENSPTTAPAAVPAAETAASPLTVLAITGGDVFIQKPGAAEWVRGETGMTLGVDYKVKTQTGGQAELTFFEGSVIELEGDTEITLAELGFTQTTSTIRLKQALGETISRVKKLADPASRYEIETQAVVAAVRGSTMYVGVLKDGKTIVGNIEGTISAIAQGVEVKLPENTRVSIDPGFQPGPPEPGATPAPPSVTPSPSPTSAPPPTSVTPPPTTDTEVTGLTVTNTPDRPQAFPGDTIDLVYTVSNSGNVALSGLTVTDDRAGPAGYLSGDENGNQELDTGETWRFGASYAIKPGEIGLLQNTVTVTGTSPGQKQASASASATVDVRDIIVKIASLQKDAVVSETITVAGTVNDPSITQATIIVNGEPSSIDVSNGFFSTVVHLAAGVNTITVTVTKAEGITASDSVQLVPVEE